MRFERRSGRIYPLLRCMTGVGLIAFGAIGAAAAGASDVEPFDCVIEPQQTVRLSSPVAGVVREVTVDRGDIVKKGQVVARLEAGVEEANLVLAEAKASSDAPIKSAEAKLDFLQRKHTRTEELLAKNVATAATYEENLANARMAEQDVLVAKLNARIAQLELDQSRAVVEQRVLRAPFDGIVTEVLLHPGEYRNDQSPVLTVAQIDPLRVEVFVPTRFYNQIRNQELALVEPEAPIGGQYEATVTVVDRVLDAASGTFGIRLQLPNSDFRLPAGLKCKISFRNVTESMTGDGRKRYGELH
jgi:RND family efflux transporter MFP subunit